MTKLVSKDHAKEVLTTYPVLNAQRFSIDFKVAMEILHALFDEMESFTNTNIVLGLRFQRLITREGAIECQVIRTLKLM